MSVLAKIFQEVKELENKGMDIIKLHVGEPKIETPLSEKIKERFSEALKEAAKKEALYGYSSPYGYEGLREKIREEFDVPENKEVIVVSGGARKACDLCMRYWKKEGKGAIAVLDPSWEGYRVLAKHNEIGLKTLFTEPLETSIDERIFRNFLEENKIECLILTLPNNPTSTIPENTEELIEICEEKNVKVYWDAAYKELCWKNEKKLPDVDIPCVSEIGSFSKSFAPGVRVGYIITVHETAKNIANIIKIETTSPPLFEQYAIAEIFEDIKRLAEERKEMCRKNARAVMKIFEKHNISCPEPHAGFYLFPKVGKIDWKKLLYEYHVALVPGDTFGGKRYEEYVRISLASEYLHRIEEGIIRMIKYHKSAL